nr:HmuY family protein [Oceanococcus sp. HetDA_MAG_MS8]
MNFSSLHLAAATLALLLAACGGGSGSEGSSSADTDSSTPDSSAPDTTKACAAADSNGVIACTIDATSFTDFAYLDLDAAELVSTDDLDAAEAPRWDLGLRRFGVILNGGASGAGAVGGAVLDSQDSFYDAEGAPNVSVFTNSTAASEYEHLLADFTLPDRLTLDSVVTAFDVAVDDSGPIWDYGWYRFDPASGTITQNDANGWLLRSNTGNSYARMRVTALDFPTRQGQGVRDFSIALDVQPAGTEQFSNSTAFSGSIPPEGGARCFDFDAGVDVDCTNPEWDLRLAFEGRSFSLRTNSGPSGEGQAAAFGPFTWQELSSYTSATIDANGGSLANLYRADSTGGVFDDQPWYEYNLQNRRQLWPNYRVYLIRGGEEATPYALQIIDYYNAAGDTSGFVTLRYRPLPSS